MRFEMKSLRVLALSIMSLALTGWALGQSTPSSSAPGSGQTPAEAGSPAPGATPVAGDASTPEKSAGNVSAPAQTSAAQTAPVAGQSSAPGAGERRCFSELRPERQETRPRLSPG